MKFVKINETFAVAEVILNRPELRNALNPEMISEITSTFRELAERPELRAIVLKGEGKVFCSGADLNWMKSMVSYSQEQNQQDAERLYEMFQAIASCPHLVIGVARGSAYGGGLGMIACCDLVLAEAQTSFCFSEVKLGLSPAIISHFILKKIPLGLVAGWMMTGRAFKTVEALAMGLVHSLAEEAEIEKMLAQILNQVGEAAPQAIRETKKLVMSVGQASPAQAKVMTTELIAKMRVGPEGQEGLHAYLEKRQPKWKSTWQEL